MKALIFLLLSAIATLGVEWTSTNKPSGGWNPGVTVGVTGGINQYITGRTTLITWSGSRAGDSDIGTSLATFLFDIAPNEVAYLPAGIYLSSIPLGFEHSNKTLRGAGMMSFSSSSNSIGTGTKVFTVPAGGAWTSGCGVKVWSRSTHPLPHPDNDSRWMKGTVTSYSGTTLTCNMTSSNGSGTYADWDVSVTVIEFTGNSGFGFGGSDAPSLNSSPPDIANIITAGTGAGSSTVTVADTSGITVGSSLIKVTAANINSQTSVPVTIASQWDASDIEDLYGWLRRHMGIVTAKTSTTVTFTPALFGDWSGVQCRLGWGTLKEKIGVENICFDAKNSTDPEILHMAFCTQSWWYRVWVKGQTSYGLKANNTVYSEIRECVIDEADNGPGSNAAGLLIETNSGLLVEDNIILTNYPSIEYNFANEGCVFGYNLMINFQDSGGVIEHGPHNEFNLYEGNIFPDMQADGYHGSASFDTFFRNFIEVAEDSPPAQTSSIGLKRFTRGFEIVGNLIGLPGIGILGTNSSYGYPNIQNANYDLPAAPPWSTFGVEQGPAGGYQEFDQNVRATTTLLGNYYTGYGEIRSSTPMTSVTGTASTDVLTKAGHKLENGDAVAITFAGGFGGLTSGATYYVSSQNQGAGTFKLAAAYALGIDGQSINITSDGTGATVTPNLESLGTTTLPNSLYRTSKPTFFGSLTWAPFNPESPGLSSTRETNWARIPAGYRFVNHAEVPSGSPGSGIETLNVQNLRVGP